MVAKLFVVGKPGCGKSAIALSLMKSDLGERYQPVIPFNDYGILKRMFDDDSKLPEEKRRFKASQHNGFTIKEDFFEVFDEALQQLEIEVNAETNTLVSSSTKPALAVIEFSRNNYDRAFRQFTPQFLQEDAYFIYLDTDISICKLRIRERIAKPVSEKTEDDYFVSDDIFKTYYDREEGLPLYESLVARGIASGNILVVQNNKTLEMILLEIRLFINSIFIRYPDGKDMLAPAVSAEFVKTA